MTRKSQFLLMASLLTAGALAPASAQHITVQSIQVQPMDQGNSGGFAGRLQPAPTQQPSQSIRRISPQQNADTARVDVYLDGRLLMANAPRWATQEVGLSQGRHVLVVVPAGAPNAMPLQRLQFNQPNARTVNISFGNKFAVNFH